MGLISNIKRRIQRSLGKADTPSPESVSDLFKDAYDALWEIEAENRDIDMTAPILALDKLLRQSEKKWKAKQEMGGKDNE